MQTVLRILALMGIFWAVAAGAADFPTRPVRLIVPFPPGGSTDALGRTLAQKLSEQWGQQVVVDNRPGGSTIVGTDLVAKAPPDGYTLLLGGSPLAINPGLFDKLPYDALRDFQPIGLMAVTPIVLVAHPSVAVDDLAGLLALARARPGVLNYASSGNGGTNHLAGELLKLMAEVDIVHVPYRGQAPAVSDLLGGQVQLMFGGIVAALPLVRSGKLKALGITGARRSPAVPDLPTIAEGGVPGYEAVAWFGLLAPAGLPGDLLAQLSHDMGTALASAEIRARLDNEGADLAPTTPEQFRQLIATEIDRWGRVVRAAKITAQ